MSWFRRGKQQRPVNPNAASIHHFRRQLRNIEWALGSLDARNPDHITEVRRLTNDHAVYRACLKEHGIIHPAPAVKW